MKIGVFGGCFNPVHKAHMEIAKKLISEGYVDKVIFVPTGPNYDKEGLVLYEHRLKMLELMIKDDKDLLVSKIGSTEAGKFTYMVLDELSKLFDAKLYFICGTDNLAEFDTWQNYEYILENYGLLIIRRANDDLKMILKKYIRFKSGIIVTDIKVDDISSTIVRKSFGEGKKEEVKTYITTPVFDYILKHRLYI